MLDYNRCDKLLMFEPNISLFCIYSNNYKPNFLATNLLVIMFWTLSNILSMLRGAMVLPLSLALWYHHSSAVAIICAAATLSDVLDGYFARKFNQISEAGKILDPLADKIFVGTMVVILAIQRAVPLWFLICVLLRDIVIFTGGIVVKSKKGIILPSNYVGKISVVFIALSLLGAAMNWGNATEYLFWISLAAMIISLVFYLMRFIEVMRTKEA
jgi:CDP-diacylglycerol--glycerol-3-phosphate 3-phosphatidyltransferase